MPNTPSQYGTMSAQDLAAEIIKRRPDLQQYSADQLVRGLIQAKPEFQNYLSKDEIERYADPAGTADSRGVWAKTKEAGKGFYDLFAGQVHAATDGPKTPEEQQIADNAKALQPIGMAGKLLGGLETQGSLYIKRASIDPGNAARKSAGESAARGDSLGVIHDSAEAALGYMGPAMIASPAAAARTIVVPGILGSAAGSLGRGDYTGAATQIGLGIVAPEALGKVGAAFRGARDVPVPRDAMDVPGGPLNRSVAPTPRAPEAVAPSTVETPQQAASTQTPVPTPADHVRAAGLVYKGELMPGSDVHMLEHPDHPGKTAAAEPGQITSPEAAKEIMARKLGEFQSASPAVVPTPEIKTTPVEAIPLPKSTDPLYAYRTRDVGETGVPSDSHSQATLSEAEARNYMASRGRITGKPQELVRFDLNGIPDHVREMGPNGNDWVKLQRPLEEASVERLPQDPNAEALAKAAPVQTESADPGKPPQFRSDKAAQLNATNTPPAGLLEGFNIDKQRLEEARRTASPADQALIDDRLATTNQHIQELSGQKPLQKIVEAPAPKLTSKFDLDGFHRRFENVAFAEANLASEKLTQRQRQNFELNISSLRSAAKDDLNSFFQKADPASHADIVATLRDEASRLRKQAEVGRKVLKTDALAGEMRDEMSTGAPAKSPAGGIQVVGSLHRDVRDVFHAALGDTVQLKFDEIAINQRARLREQGLDPDQAIPEGYRRLDPAEWTKVKVEATNKLETLKAEFAAKLKDRVQDFLDRNPSKALEGGAEEAKGGIFKQLLAEKDAEEMTFADRVKELRDIAGRDPQRPVYAKKGAPVRDEEGVVRPAGQVGEKSLAFANEFFGRKNLNKIPEDAKWEARSKDFERRAALLDVVIKKLESKIPNASERGAASVGTMASSVIGAGIGAKVGYAVAGTPGAVFGGALGFAGGFALPALYQIPAVSAVVSNLAREVGELGYSAVGTGKDITMGLVNFLAPKVGVPTESLNAIFRMKGDIAASMRSAANVLDVYRKNIESLPTSAQIDFIDRHKSGLPQATPELQAASDMIRQLDKENYDKTQLFRPNLTFLENHFRMLYKTLPGATTAKGFEGWVGSRPLAGSKGFLHQHVYDTLSDAMANGGVPVTTNPIDLFLMGHADVSRFVHANMLFSWAKSEGITQFVKTGSKMPDGFVALDDRIAKVYFPASSGEGLINAGQYAVEKNFGRVMNNYLSTDYIRGNIIGKKIVDAKNIWNGWELMGGFHAVLINNAALVQNLNLAGQRMYNLGIRGGKLSEVAGGFKDLVNAPVELALGNAKAWKEGRNLEAFTAAMDQSRRGNGAALTHFSASPEGQKFLQTYPNAGELMGDADMGGLNLHMSNDLRSNITKTMMQSFKDKNYIGAGARVLPSALYEMNRPLFDNYIPRVKLGMFMRDMSMQLKDRAPDLLAGTLTREELARKVVQRTENVFGEMNFDNLFWNKTLKTSLQLGYRSITWRLGTTLAEGGGIYGQGKELVAAAKAGELPRLDPNFGFVATALLTLGVTSAVMQKMMTGKNPQSLTDLLHPMSGGMNERGKPNRMNIPGYGSEFVKLTSNPTGYAMNGRAGWVDKFMESWNNKDFYGRSISNPNDGHLMQFGERLLHMAAPTMIMASNIDKLKDAGVEGSKLAWGMAGFSPASKNVDSTAAELKAQELVQMKLPQGGGTTASVARNQAMNRVVSLYRNNKSQDAWREFQSQVKAGTLKIEDYDKIDEKSSTPYIVELTKDSHISLQDVMSVYRLATPEEQKLLKPVLLDKSDQLSKLSAVEQRATWAQLQPMLGGK